MAAQPTPLRRTEEAPAARSVAGPPACPDARPDRLDPPIGSLDAYSAVDGSLARKLASLRHPVHQLASASDGERLAVASRVVALIDLRHGGVVGELRAHREHPYDVDFDARGARLVSCATDKSVALHETQPLRERRAVR